jgi:hypothetical protein
MPAMRLLTRQWTAVHIHRSAGHPAMAEGQQWRHGGQATGVQLRRNIIHTMNTEPLSWHQHNAIRRNYRLRNRSAHIKANGWTSSGLMLCGLKDAPVTIDPEHRKNPANKPCARCVRIADKLGLLVKLTA